MIPDSFIQDLLARVDVADVVGRYVQLKKGGINLLGLCPFHNEKSPSFTVSPTKQFYHCFGCGAHGSAITFLIEHSGYSFPEAISQLAASAGMVVPQEQRSPKQDVERDRCRDEVSQHTKVLQLAQDFYRKQLSQSPEAIAYLKKRGLTGQTAKQFGLGWASADRQGLSRVFSQYADPLLVESGLVIQSDDGRRYDRFRERVMFPIHNAKGDLIGFGGRIIGKGEPKYLNSPETPVFSKGQELYGLHEAKAAIRKEACVIVVEGYMDVVGLAQLGVGNAVATLGTATTAVHIQKLLRSSDRIIFSFDGDKAGRRAAWRALETCLPLLRDDVSIRFLFLPAEHDPDSYIRQFGPEAFRACMADSDALSVFFLNELASRYSLKEAEGRARLVHEAKPLLSQIPTSMVKVQLQNELAKLAQLTPEELNQLLEQPPILGPQSLQSPPSSQMSPELTGQIVQPQAQEGTRTRTVRHVSNRATRRAVTPLARRLLGLLLAHPSLAEQMGDQQLDVLEQGEYLEMVLDLIVLIQKTHARHIGALIQTAEPGSDLEALLISVSADLMSQEELPDPEAEWADALRRIEIDNLKREQSALIASGENNLQLSQKYQELSRRITRLIGVVNPGTTR